MPLPQEWANVDWRLNAVLLPEMTEGVRTKPLSRDRYPQVPRGYFMTAASDSQGMLIYYNPIEVSEAGPLVSQFVFWHEMGHFHLGHVSGVPGSQLEGVSPRYGTSYTRNHETDADRFAFNYWIRQRSMHGIQVIESAIAYLVREGNAPGDAQHPPARDRQNLLSVYLDNSRWEIIVHHDQVTNPDFVRQMLADSFRMTGEVAEGFIKKLEQDGQASIKSILKSAEAPRNQRDYDINKTRAQLLMMDIALYARLTGNFSFRMEARPL